MTSVLEHKAKAPKKLKFAIIVCSTSRYLSSERGENVEDITGNLATRLVEKKWHDVIFKTIVPDDKDAIRSAVREALAVNVDIIITCGGTGIAPSDVTIEAIRPLLEKEIPGFGELFRRLSFEKIGSAAFLTRALAGVIGKKAIFCIPGSPHAVKLALESLILKESPHLMMHLRES
jgi:molybdenum cofactor biosynthesis protein B